MSLVLNMVGGGGGSLKDTDAILTVTVPTGSTVTATKGGVTLTPTMWVKAADNTLDCALFVISPSMFDSQNAWTVTATLGTDTASDTVLITSNKEYEIMLSFTFWLYYYGNTMDAVTGGYYAKSQRATDSGYYAQLPDITYNSDNMYISFPTSSAGIVYTNNAIDVTEFTTLCALVDLTGSAPTSGNYYLGLLSTTTTAYWFPYLTPSLSLGSQTPGTGVEIGVDITEVTGSRYIAFAQNSNINGRITVHKMWLE